MHSRIPDLLQIRYPILQGGMLWLADSRLAAAVCEAGGLGVVSPYAGMVKDGDPMLNLQHLIADIRTRTRRPFGVNIPLDLPQSGSLIDRVLADGVGIVVTAAGSADRYTSRLKSKGTTVLHVVSTVRQAQKAEKAGVDAIVAEGVEAGAHNGPDEIPLMSLLPQIVDAVRLPVIAAGGIVEARGSVAAFALGAEGVQLGTRFIATEECIAHIHYKQAICRSEDTDTFVTSRSLVPTRSLKTPFSMTLDQLEKAGASGETLAEYVGYRRSWDSQLAGNLEEGELYAGSSAGLIEEILPVATVVQELVEGFKRITGELAPDD